MTIPDTGAGTRAVEAVADSAGAAPAGDVGGTDDAFVLAQQAACEQLAVLVGRAAACRATGVPRSSWYRHNRITPAAAAAGAEAARRAGAAAGTVAGRADHSA